PVTMADAAEALIQADIDLYGGIHTGTLVSRLSARGFVDATAYGPALAHDPLHNTENLGGTVPIEVLATGSTSPVDSVIVYYGTTPIPLTRLVLEPVGGGLYRGDLPLPSTPDTLRYYIEAVDALGRRSFLPENGATEAYVVLVGPDTIPPVIIHTQILSSSLAAWPAVVTATVHDALGVDTVYVAYSAHDSLDNRVAIGTFGLKDTLGVYMAPFPIDVSLLGPGSRVVYRIYARDASSARNLTQLPDESYFNFRVVVEGVLRAYDFEHPDPTIVATGAWALDEPRFGVRRAHSGDSLWATNPSGAYPASPQLSTLEMPRLNLVALDKAYLVFWHWYDFEHNGQAVPDSSKEVSLWDGGNVKVSVDDGRTWTIAIPEGGYPGIVESGLDNPLSGEPAFGGYSYGWRQVVVPLPTASSVQVRFDFGSDLSNQDVSVAFAGWYIDDVVVTTELPEDAGPPEAVATNPEEILRSPGQPLPRVAVFAYDDIGIGLADVRYEFYPAQGVPVEGRFRLAMADTSLTYFDGAFPIAREFGSGDRIEFRIRVRDFAGNQVELPDRSQPPFRILYRHLDRIPLLSTARGSGHWVEDGAELLWHLQNGPHQQRSGLVLDRVDLPENAEILTLELRHDYRFENGAGGNVKVSANGGKTWTIVSPDHGYGGILNVAPPHPMAGQQIFTGEAEGMTTSRFDLTPFAGEQIQIRVDLGLARPLRTAEWWRVTDAAIVFATQDPEFSVPRTLALHPNFPDPFAESTSISYTLAERAHVVLEVFDLLGRRIAVLEDGEQEAGTYTTTFSANGLASGMYLLRLRAGSAQRVERLIVAR
ncbi:MAG TPA: T9SS type A sorting domain-containing protein, partial [Rhodothermales bacterium]